MDFGTSPDWTGRARLWMLVAITVILAGWALRATGAFMVPVVFSIFLALLVAPLDRKVSDRVPEKLGWLGHLVAMSAILVSLLIFVGLIWFSAQQVVERFPLTNGSGPLLPNFGDEVRGNPGGTAPDTSTGPAAATTAGAGSTSEAADGQASSLSGFLDRFYQLFAGAGGSLIERFRDWASGMATQILSAAGAVLFATVLTFFLTLIMLIEGPKWRQKIVNVLDKPASDKAMNAIGVIADRLRRYLLARTILGVVTAALYGAWLWIFGVDLLVVWVLLAFLLNYVPTLGSLVAGILPVGYAFVQKDLGTAVAIGAGIFVIEQVMGNYVDPRVQGRQVSLSSLVVLVTLLVWGWIWGVAGAILAVPITIAAMIISAHVAPLRPFALMLSNAGDMGGLDRQAGVQTIAGS